jgi:hypothetical protein
MINVGKKDLCLPGEIKEYQPLQISNGDVMTGKQTLDWYPMDSEQRFKENFTNHPTNKSLLTYKKNPIQYKLNEYGFRSDSFDTEKPGNVFLGCSHTFGIGNYMENTWSHKVNKKVGGKFFNLASPGKGIMTSLRLLRYWSSKLNIKNIFHYQPIYPRYEFYGDGSSEKSDTNIHYRMGADDLASIKDRELRGMLASDNHILELYKNSILAISAIAQTLGVKYYYYCPWSEISSVNAHDHVGPINESLQARDLAHHGFVYNHAIANLFYKNIPGVKQVII